MTITVDVLDDWTVWPTLIIGGLAAAGTLFAVIWSVISTRAANARAELAQGEATASQRAVTEAHRNVARVTEQANEQLLEFERRKDTAEWAKLQAVQVRLATDKSEIARSQLGNTDWRVVNDSIHPITNIVVAYDPPELGMFPGGSRAFVAKFASVPGNESRQGNAMPSGLTPMSANPEISVVFTDYFKNRWRLRSNGDLLLREPRRLAVDTDTEFYERLDPAATPEP